MEGSKLSLHHFLIVILASCFSGAQQSTNITSSAVTVVQNDLKSTPFESQPYPDSSFPETNVTNVPGCLIDPQLGLVAVASAGGLILCLLVSTMVLACQVFRLQHRGHLHRPSRSNMDLVSGTGYWGTDRPEVAGIMGPCEDSDVMLEEVRADRMEDFDETEEREESEREEEKVDEGTVSKAMDAGSGEMPMQSSDSRDSCQEIPVDLENMPLVV